MISVPVGPYMYEIHLVKGLITDRMGRQCLGTCDTSRQRIEVSDQQPPAKRIATLYHELAHAWQTELDIHEAKSLGGEALANLIGLAMAGMSARQCARLHVLLTRGIACDDVMFLMGCDDAIPVMKSLENQAFLE